MHVVGKHEQYVPAPGYVESRDVQTIQPQRLSSWSTTTAAVISVGGIRHYLAIPIL